MDSPLGRGLGSLIPQKNVSRPIVSEPRVIARPSEPAPVATVQVNLPEKKYQSSDVSTDVVGGKPGSTFSEEDAVGLGKRIFDIPVGLIDPNPHQPRHTIGGEPLEDLVNSIRQHGIIQPLIATRRDGRYQLIAGERRFRAAQKLGLPSVPAIVRDTHELEQLELAIVENVQREDLNPIEEALGYHQLSDEFGLTQEEIAKKVGKSRATVANAIRMLSLPPEMQQALRQGTMTTSHAKILLSAVTPAERQRLFEQILEQKLPVRAAARLGQQTTVRRYTRRAVDPLIQAKEDSLRTALGTKVTITKREHRGSVAIEFYSDEELESLFNRLQSTEV